MAVATVSRRDTGQGRLGHDWLFTSTSRIFLDQEQAFEGLDSGGFCGTGVAGGRWRALDGAVRCGKKALWCSYPRYSYLDGTGLSIQTS